MKKLQILGAALVALFALGSLVASAAFAQPTFLLAEWLLTGAVITTPDLVEIDGELNLINLDGGGLGVTIEILCSGILDGTVGPASADLITELLNLAEEKISGTALSGLELVCTDTKNCENPLVWAEELPWETELELMEGVTGGPFFVDLILNGRYYAECTLLGTKMNELCSAPEVAVQATNEEPGTVTLLFSDSFQELAGLKLGACGSNAETAEITGEGLILVFGGGQLTVSSGA